MQENKNTIQSIEKAAKLLLLFEDPMTDELSIQEISEKLGVPKSTAHRLANTLVQSKLLEQNEQNQKYALGISSGIIGRRYLESKRLEKSALKHIRKLVQACNESVSLNVRDGCVSVVLERIDSEHPMRVVAPVGMRTPLYCSCSGKCFLAFASPELRESLYEQLQPLKAFTPETITDMKRLRAEVERVARRGFSMECEEVHLGMFTLAAPIRKAGGDVYGALTVSGPRERLIGNIKPYCVEEQVWRQKVEPIVQSLLAQCEAFSRELGWRPSDTPELPEK